MPSSSDRIKDHNYCIRSQRLKNDSHAKSRSHLSKESRMAYSGQND